MYVEVIIWISSCLHYLQYVCYIIRQTPSARWMCNTTYLREGSEGSPTTFRNAWCTCSVKSPACRLLPFSLNANFEHSLVIAEPPYYANASVSAGSMSPS